MLHDLLHDLVDLVHMGDNKRGELHHRIEQARDGDQAEASEPVTADPVPAKSDEPAKS